MQRLKLKVIKTSVRGQSRWCVRVPALGGKRTRRFFTSKADAETFLELKKIEQANYGVRGVSLTEQARGEYLNAVEKLAPYGISLTEAVDMLLPTLAARNKTRTVSQLVAEILKSKASDGASLRYIKDLRTRLNIFAGCFPDEMVTALTTARIDDWLRGLPHSSVTRNNYRRLVGVLLSYAVQRGYALTNPVTATSKAKQVDKPPGILSPEQAMRLLKQAEPEIVPAIALGLFAGLRPEAEVWRLDWEDIDFESGLVRMEAAKTKSARHRLVEMTDNLKLWLLPHRKATGPVSPKGDAYFMRLERAREKAEIKTWPADALRHCYGTYHYAKMQEPGRTMVQMGHTNPHTFHAHYRARVTPADAARFWEICPGEQRQ